MGTATATAVLLHRFSIGIYNCIVDTNTYFCLFVLYLLGKVLTTHDVSREEK